MEDNGTSNTQSVTPSNDQTVTPRPKKLVKKLCGNPNCKDKVFMGTARATFCSNACRQAAHRLLKSLDSNAIS